MSRVIKEDLKQNRALARVQSFVVYMLFIARTRLSFEQHQASFAAVGNRLLSVCIPQCPVGLSYVGFYFTVIMGPETTYETVRQKRLALDPARQLCGSVEWNEGAVVWDANLREMT